MSEFCWLAHPRHAPILRDEESELSAQPVVGSAHLGAQGVQTW